MEVLLNPEERNSFFLLFSLLTPIFTMSILRQRESWIFAIYRNDEGKKENTGLTDKCCQE